MKQRTLEERILKRCEQAGHDGPWPRNRDHVCAELDRLARQVRGLYTTQGSWYGDGTCVRLTDVLALIKESKR